MRLDIFQRRISIIFLTVALGTSVCGCGLKGPLVLPPTDSRPMPLTPLPIPGAETYEPVADEPAADAPAEQAEEQPEDTKEPIPETQEPESERAPLGELPGSLPTLP